tara:strand:- start:4124 stop:4477 length:354 start_codon:yes stop_codon:yes gene_type:complete
MLHVILFFACILSIEIFIRLGFKNHLSLLVEYCKKVVSIIPNKFISDHWKEQAVPLYAFGIMKCSLKILFILISIITIFILLDFATKDLLLYTFSIIGIMESILFGFSYTYIRKYIF